MHNDSDTVTIRISKAYGRVLIYPHCDKARAVCKAFKTKTLSKRMLILIEDLGFIVKVDS